MRLGPVLRVAEDFFSALVILAATAFGLQEGYGRSDSPFFADLRPQGLPVLTSTHSSLNHFLRAAPFLLFLTATFVTPVLSADFAAFSYSTGSVCRRPYFVPRLDLLCTSVVSFFSFSFRHNYFFLFFLLVSNRLLRSGKAGFFFLGGVAFIL